MDRRYSIQVLRGIAAMMVVFAHLGYFLSLYGVSFYNGKLLEIGVDIFFLISGYIMYGIVNQSHSGWMPAWTFVIHRVSRLIPLYWLLTFLLLLLYLLVYHVPLGTRDPTILLDGNLISTFLLLPTFLHGVLVKPLLNVGWSLIYEFYFYLLMVFCILLSLKGWKMLLFVGGVLLAVFLLGKSSNPYLAYYGDGISFLYWVGCCCGALLSNKYHESFGFALPFSLMVIGLSLLGIDTHITEAQHGSLLWSVASTSIFLSMVLLEKRINWKTFSPLILLGDASYSLYLIHLPLLGESSSRLLPWMFALLSPILGKTGVAILYMVLAVVFVICLSIVSYERFERPLNRFLVGKWNKISGHLPSREVYVTESTIVSGAKNGIH